MTRIYLDHAATTPLSKRAHEAMRPFLESEFGNPSSPYQEGRRSRAAIDLAREQVSTAVGCSFPELLFCSSGTEAANWAILGSALETGSANRPRVLFSAGEHHCVLHCRKRLEAWGFNVDLVRIDNQGTIDLDDLNDKLDETVLLVAAMSANNELGTIQPVESIAQACKRVGALFFCDAVQGVGELPAPFELGADLVSYAAHKFGGPKGVGALAVRAGTKIQPLHWGGGQEREMRAGTENVSGIVGMGAAITAPHKVDKELKAMMVNALHESGIQIERTLNIGTACLASHLHLRLPGISAESVLIVLDRFGVSAGSGAACSSGSIEPSHVLLACGKSEIEAKEALRFTYGPDTTIEEAAEAGKRLVLAARTVIEGKR